MTETTPPSAREQSSESDPTEDFGRAGDGVESRHRRWPWMVGGLVIVATAAAAFLIFSPDTASEVEASATEFNTAEVVITDLVERTTIDGTLGREAGNAIDSTRAGTLTYLPEAGDVISLGEVLFAIDAEPVLLLQGSSPAYRDITLDDDIDIASELAGQITSLPERSDLVASGDVLFEIDGEPVVLLEGILPAYRDLGLVDVAVEIATGSAGFVTSLPDEDDMIEQGDVLFEIDDHPVVLLYGDIPATRTLAEEAVTLVGDDVLQLERALVEMGYASEDDLDVDGEFTSETADAVAEWQSAIGIEATGVVDLGEVVFLPGAIRVEAVEVAADDEVSVDDLLFSATGTATISGDDVLQLERALVDLGYASEDDLDVDGVFTSETETAVAEWQADIGAHDDGIVDLGEVVFLAGPIDIVDVTGRIGDLVGSASILNVVGPEAMSGSDVLQLEEALSALGYDADGSMVVDGVMSPETVTAVVAWQAATGQVVDGVVNLGDVVFVDGDVRVSSVVTPLGGTVTPGAPLLQITGNTVSVTAELGAEDQGIIVIGDPVIIELPDGTRTPGSVTDVATVATTTPDGRTVFNVTISLDDPSAAGDLDEAPVEVDIVTDSVTQVVAVPVTALLALREGGYAVEVDDGSGTIHLVAVDPGFFADGLVELQDADLEAGALVVIP